MRLDSFLATVALSAMLPSMALAQATCEERSANRTAGTVAGAAAGALLGGAVAGRHDKVAGAVVGGVAGAVIGNQLARGPRDCQHAYGWYDNDGQWHGNAVDTSNAYGYFDRNGEWVDGTPPDYRSAQYYPAPRSGGDWDDRQRWEDRRYDDEWRRWQGYPEFRDQEQRLRFNIRDSVREDMIEPGDARELMDQLRDIRQDEARDFQSYGWRLPWQERRRFHDRLDGLERRLGEMREEP